MSKTFPGLSGNQLKIIALVSMTLDHIGLTFFPNIALFRILGRLAFPLFAYMIAEGCRYTRSRTRYLLSVAGLGAICQLVYLIAMGSLYQCILITFSLSIGLIYLLDYAMQRTDKLWPLIYLIGLAAVWFLSEELPGLLPRSDYAIDYGFFGILLPVCIYIARHRKQAILHTGLGLLCLCLVSGGLQWYCLAALPLLMLYNGQRGKLRMKNLFYIYYPLHLVVIYLVSCLI